MRDNRVYLGHILDSAKDIEEFTKDLTFDEFKSSRKTYKAVERSLEIIGEAVKNLDKSFQNKYSQIEWKKVAGLRDVLIHHYFGVDYKLLWKIVTKDISKLKQNIKKILEKESL